MTTRLESQDVDKLCLGSMDETKVWLTHIDDIYPNCLSELTQINVIIFPQQGSNRKPELVKIPKIQAVLTLVSGTSMMPIIGDGNKVIIEYIHPKNIKLGDLIVFRSFENIVTHRVIGMYYIKSHKFFIEKGDFSFNSSIVAEEDVIGKVIAIENTDGIIDIDNRSWRLVSYTIVIYTYLAHPLVKGLQFAKRNFHDP